LYDFGRALYEKASFAFAQLDDEAFLDGGKRLSDLRAAEWIKPTKRPGSQETANGYFL
jgi:hypothetical protein